MSIENLLSQSLQQSLEAKQRFWAEEKPAFLSAGKLLVDAVRSKRKVLIFGNGGSACDALHFAGEWVNRYLTEREPLACLALTGDAPLMSCIGNDYSFEKVFERQVLAFGQAGDVGIGISTSGNSPNVILALKACRSRGMKTIGLLGGSGGKISEDKVADLELIVKASNITPRIQETHEWILHSLCEYVDHELFPPR